MGAESMGSVGKSCRLAGNWNSERDSEGRC